MINFFTWDPSTQPMLQGSFRNTRVMTWTIKTREVSTSFGNQGILGFLELCHRSPNPTAKFFLNRCLKITSLATRQNTLRLPWELNPEVVALLGNIDYLSAISDCSRSAFIPVSCARPKMRRNSNNDQISVLQTVSCSIDSTSVILIVVLGVNQYTVRTSRAA